MFEAYTTIGLFLMGTMYGYLLMALFVSLPDDPRYMDDFEPLKFSWKGLATNMYMMTIMVSLCVVALLSYTSGIFLESYYIMFAFMVGWIGSYVVVCITRALYSRVLGRLLSV